MLELYINRTTDVLIVAAVRLLKEVMESRAKPEILASGFKACRFHPLNWITVN